MKYFEPFQRLDHYTYITAENAVYIKSSVSVFLPAGYTVVGRDPNYSSVAEATLNYITAVDNSAVDSYILEQDRLVKFMEKVPEASASMDPRTLTAIVQEAIKVRLSKSQDAFTMHCIIYNTKGAVGGQVTNTISSQAEVVVL